MRGFSLDFLRFLGYIAIKITEKCIYSTPLLFAGYLANVTPANNEGNL